MKPLRTNRLILTWLSIYATSQSPNKRDKLIRIAVTSSFLIGFLSGNAAFLTFFMRYVSIDLEMSLYALFSLAAGAGLAFMYSIAFCSRHRISAIFKSLSEIYNENANKDSSQYLTHVNNKCEWIWKMYLIYAMGGFVVNNTLMSVFSILFNYLKNETFDAKHVFHAYKVVLPWDQATVFGYFLEICCDIIFGESYFLANGSLLLLFVSICWHHQAFHCIHQHKLRKLETIGKFRNDKKVLCELIHFQNTAKTWFVETAEVYSPIILIQLVSSVIFLALIVFQLDLQFRHIDFSAIIILTGGLVSASNLFLYCFFGKLATESYEKMAISLYESNWQEFSIDLKKYSVLMIRCSQKSIFYHGYGLVRLHLETFTYCIKTVFSYYMMFKTLTKK